MPCKVAWSRLARNDMLAIADYVALEKPIAAAKLVEEIEQKCASLETYPTSGRKYNASFRVIVHGNYLIFYRHIRSENQVRIVAVMDGRRDYAGIVKNLISGLSDTRSN